MMLVRAVYPQGVSSSRVFTLTPLGRNRWDETPLFHRDWRSVQMAESGVRGEWLEHPRIADRDSMRRSDVCFPGLARVACNLFGCLVVCLRAAFAHSSQLQQTAKQGV